MPPWARLALTALGYTFAIPLGCRAVLGIEEREIDPAAAEDLSCEAYCDRIMETCAGPEKQQYPSKEACLGLCSTFPRGSPDDTSGNTLGCRMKMAKIAVEAGDCAAAGPEGNGTCGSSCVSFCESAMAVCPDAFGDVNTCEGRCGLIPSCGTYHVDPAVTPNDPSLQCRIFHLSVGAIGLPSDAGPTPSQTHHCPHVAGIGECVLVQGAACPPGSGGS